MALDVEGRDRPGHSNRGRLPALPRRRPLPAPVVRARRSAAGWVGAAGGATTSPGTGEVASPSEPERAPSRGMRPDPDRREDMMRTRSLIAVLLGLAAASPVHAQPQPALAAARRARVDSLLARMTLEEKVGQMTQL